MIQNANRNISWIFNRHANGNQEFAPSEKIKVLNALMPIHGEAAKKQTVDRKGCWAGVVVLTAIARMDPPVLPDR